jgi:hypothetical protein
MAFLRCEACFTRDISILPYSANTSAERVTTSSASLVDVNQAAGADADVRDLTIRAPDPNTAELLVRNRDMPGWSDLEHVALQQDARDVAL